MKLGREKKLTNMSKYRGEIEAMFFDDLFVLSHPIFSIIKEYYYMDLVLIL